MPVDQTPTSWKSAIRGMNLQNRSLEQQMKRAQEQWDWQKRLYRQQAASSQQAGGALGQLVNQYNQAYGEAKAANEARYQQLLGIADKTTGQRLADIRSDYANQAANTMQNLARLGLSNTTIAPTLQLGNQRELQASLNRAADELQGTKLGIIERRTDEYPNVNLITSLASALGNTSGGVGIGNLISALGNLKLGGAAA